VVVSWVRWSVSHPPAAVASPHPPISMPYTTLGFSGFSFFLTSTTSATAPTTSAIVEKIIGRSPLSSRCRPAHRAAAPAPGRCPAAPAAREPAQGGGVWGGRPPSGVGRGG